MDLDRGTHRMPIGAGARHDHDAGRLVPSTAGWTAAGATLCLTAALSSLLLPAPLVLPATGCVLAIAGFAVASALLLAGRRMGRDATTGWDAAAALVFFGFAATLLADTGAALTALAELRAR
jgi:hypothetical protein